MREAPRIRILLVESGRAMGGTERVVWELATRLPAARFEVRVWLSPSRGVDEFAAALESADVPVDRVAEVDSRWDWKGMLDTWSRLRRLRPAVLHVHHVWPAADRYLTLLARAAGVPHVVVTEHITGESHSGGQRALKRDELRRADAVTAVTGAIVETLVRDYAIERSRVRVVPNGADLPDDAAEEPVAKRWRDRFLTTPFKPLWVVAGRLEEQKGHDLLFQALAGLVKQGLDFTLVVAGEGSRRSWLEQQSLSLGLAPRVQFVGQIEDVGGLLAAADAVLLPSRWEGLPLILLEAMARARPVVATAVGGVVEVMQDGVTGTLVPPGDVPALAAALVDLQRKADRGVRMGRSAAAIVREHYTWPAVVDGFESVYDEVLGLATVTPEPVPSARGGGR
ncbi:MAG TPA: glycosyltransferase family 4 protein [Candidatus Eisenbacteria bacterium]|jgi:glycosyltransferase involved in cell wall biosynthesis